MYRITMPQALTKEKKPFAKAEENPLNGASHRRVGVTFGDGVALEEELTHSQLFTFTRKGYIIEKKSGKTYSEIDVTEELQRLNPKLESPKASKKSGDAKAAEDPKEVAKGAAEETKASK